MSMRIPQLGKSNNSNFDANNKLTHILALKNCEYQNFKLRRLSIRQCAAHKRCDFGNM